MKLLNLGILAHVDAGKTSLTERLLLAAGVIDQLGRVDHGTTQTDTLVLERQRGITIRSAVTSFVLDDDTVVNLIDTPGHPDFIAEVERVLAVLDGVVLVVSAVEGVQAQTRVLMRALRRLGLPTVIFVNKIDRVGARTEALLPVLSDRLGVSVLPMSGVTAAGRPDARVSPYPEEVFTRLALDRLAAQDDELLANYLTDPARLSPARVRTELGRQTRRQQISPVYFGSALTGAGTDELMAGLGQLLPTTMGTGEGPPSGTVFKVERGPAGERIAYVRMFTGTLRTRDRQQFGSAVAEKITQIRVFDRGSARPAGAVSPGQIGQLWGLRTVQVGDSTGTAPTGVTSEFAPPSLESVVVPAHPDDQGALFLALTQLAEQDPLIDLRQDEGRGELSVSLYGEVQKEVLAATLAADYGLTVTFRPTTTRCIERLVGPGAAVEHIATPPNPFLATVGLRLSPAPVGSGVSFELEIELGSMPLAFFRAIEETARRELAAGLSGWPVPDCVVTVTHGKYWPRQSHAHATFDKAMSSTGRDFRHLTPLVVVDALRRAGTRVHEPIHHFELEVPDDVVPAVLPAVARAQGVALDQVPAGSATRITGTIPAARVQQLRQELPPLSRGEGLLDTTFSHFAPVGGRAPTRPRPEPDATHRKSYLLEVERRVSSGVGR